MKSLLRAVTQKDWAAVGSADWVRVQAEVLLNGADSEYPYAYVREVYPDRIVIEAGYGNLVQLSYSVQGSELDLDMDSAAEVSLTYVPKSPSPVLTGPIVMKSDDELRIAYAAVLVPGEPDSDGDVVSAQKVAEVAHDWLASYRNIDLMHTLSSAGAVPVESYVTPADMEVGDYSLPAGTWVLASYVEDEDVWKAIKDGALTGYSIMGVRKAMIASKSEADDDEAVALKRTLLSDLGDDWVCPFVSIVDAPAVPKAKFFALKRKAKPSMATRVTRALTDKQPTLILPAEKKGARYSKTTRAAITAIEEAVATLLADVKAQDKDDDEDAKSKKSDEGTDDMTPEELQAAVSAAVAPIVERLDKLEAPVATATTDAESSATETDDDVETLKAQVAELQSFQAEVEKRIAPAAKSRALRGQDTDSAEQEQTTKASNGASDRSERDSLGRSRTKVHSPQARRAAH